MSRMSELLPPDQTYPTSPGYKVPGPSQDAARLMAGSATKLRAAVLEQIVACPGGATADEIAQQLNLSMTLPDLISGTNLTQPTKLNARNARKMRAS